MLSIQSGLALTEAEPKIASCSRQSPSLSTSARAEISLRSHSPRIPSPLLLPYSYRFSRPRSPCIRHGGQKTGTPPTEVGSKGLRSVVGIRELYSCGVCFSPLKHSIRFHSRAWTLQRGTLRIPSHLWRRLRKAGKKGEGCVIHCSSCASGN